MSQSTTFVAVKEILFEALALDSAVEISQGTPLLDSLPELDSMGVVALLTSLESRFGIVIDDDEFSGEIFETTDTLVDFVEAKLASM